MKSKMLIYLRLLLTMAFLATSLGIKPVSAGEVVVPLMPKPGTMVNLSPIFTPAVLNGVVINPDNALKFDFLINKGQGNLDINQKNEEYTKLVKYFLASLTIPDEDQWVNLSPYERDRIIKEDFGKTQMGRDLLTQDYLLKQITASLMYPESGIGQDFWNKVYERSLEKFGNTQVPVNTFNKVWIVPDEALIYESGNTAYIIKSHLKVMLEEDYLSLDKHAAVSQEPNKTHTVTSKVIKEVILPELENEVNTGKNFAQLRQIYSGMVLASWYKKALKESLLGKVYANKAKVVGVNQPACRQAGIPCDSNKEIYQQYLIAFKKGVYNYIKEDVDKYTQQIIPRKYFSGGFMPNDKAIRVERVRERDMASVAGPAATNIDLASVALNQTTSKLENDFNHLKKLANILSTQKRFFNKGGSFGISMATAIIITVEEERLGEQHRAVLDRMRQARIAAARSLPNDSDEQKVITSLQKDLREQERVGMVLITNNGPYADLAKEIDKKSPQFVDNEEKGIVEFVHDEPIGNTGVNYRKIIEKEYVHELQRRQSPVGQNVYKVYLMPPELLKHVMPLLDELWQKALSPSASMEDKYDALARYEWWFNHANPFGRAAASIGDAMSLTAQIKNGMPLRKEFEHVNFDILSMTLDEYVAERVKRFKKDAGMNAGNIRPGVRRFIESFEPPSYPVKQPGRYAIPAIVNTTNVIGELNATEKDALAEELRKQRSNISNFPEVVRVLNLQDRFFELKSIENTSGFEFVVSSQKPIVFQDKKGLTWKVAIQVSRQADKPPFLYASRLFELYDFDSNVGDPINFVGDARLIGGQMNAIGPQGLWSIGDVEGSAITRGESNTWLTTIKIGGNGVKVLQDRAMSQSEKIGEFAQGLINGFNQIAQSSGNVALPQQYQAPAIKEMARGYPPLNITEAIAVGAALGRASGKGLDVNKIAEVLIIPKEYLFSDNAMFGQTRIRNVAESIETDDFKKGGIDLNAANLNFQIKRDGRGVPLPLPQQDMKLLNTIEGFVPTILEIKPATTLPMFSLSQGNPDPSST